MDSPGEKELAAQDRASPDRGKARILVVDDHPVVRQGLSLALGKQAGLQVCGEAGSLHDALRAIGETRPDLVLSDLDLEGSSGIDLIKAIRETNPDLPVLILSMHDEEVYAERVLRAGACGYMTKQSTPERLAAGVRSALAGEIVLSDPMKSKILQGLSGRRDPGPAVGLDKLTDRELEVFRLIGEGQATRQIAERLSISVKTVEAHIAHLKSKLGAETGRDLQHRAYGWSQGGSASRPAS
jgi:DNA-binding NarL/FixJ family response regulator